MSYWATQRVAFNLFRQGYGAVGVVRMLRISEKKACHFWNRFCRQESSSKDRLIECRGNSITNFYLQEMKRRYGKARFGKIFY